MKKLFLTDIDGVWTDGGMYYNNEQGEWKKFNTADSAGVLFLKLLDIPTGIITGEDTEIVRRRAAKLNIPYVHMGVKNKLKIATELCLKLNITLKDVAYIGDDINDIPLLRSVGMSACPMSAPLYVKSEVQHVIPVDGGDGVFRAFVEKALMEEDLMDHVLGLYYKHLDYDQ